MGSQEDRKEALPPFNQTQGKNKSLQSASHLASRKKMFSFCDDQKFSDICVIGSDDLKFHAHKCVLSASSDYFLTMFGSDLKEARDSEVKIHEVTGEILKPILAFMYTGGIELQSTTIEDVLKAANFLQIKSLIMECYTFMGEELDAKNCLGIALFAEQLDIKELYEKAYKFASLHFESVQNEEEFLKLNEDQLCLLISSEDLCVSSEEQVFLSLIKWIEHDQQNREKSIVNLFSNVKYWLLSSNFIKQHRSKLGNQIETLQLVCTWLEWHIMSSDSRELKSIEASTFQRSSKLVAIFRGHKQVYDLESNTWTNETVSDIPYNFDKAVVVNKKIIFLLNGQNLLCVDLKKKETTVLTTEMNRSRREFAIAELNGMLYAVGGRTLIKDQWMRCVDKFDFSSKKWQAVAPTNSIFSSPQVAVAGGLLYVISHNNVMECFNPDLNKWTSKPSTPNVSNFGFTGVNQKLYIVGGQTKNVYNYDPKLEKWELIENMRLELAKPKCVSWNNQLIVWGGYDSTNTLLNLVQKYNPESKTWTNMVSPLHLQDNCSYDILNF